MLRTVTERRQQQTQVALDKRDRRELRRHTTQRAAELVGPAREWMRTRTRLRRWPSAPPTSTRRQRRVLSPHAQPRVARPDGMNSNHLPESLRIAWTLRGRPQLPQCSEPPPCGSRKHHAEPTNALVRDPAISSIAVKAAPAQSDPGLRLHGGRGKSQRPTAAADQTSARQGHGSGRDPSIGSYRIPAMSGVLRRPPASASTGSLPVRHELGHVGDGLREYRDHTDAGVSAGVGSGPAVRHKRASGACRLRASTLIEAVVRAGHRRWSQGGDERR